MPVPASDFLPHEPASAIVFSSDKGDELCPGGTELSKSAKRYCRQSSEIEFTSDFGHFNPLVPR
jgi:hypothetical protein